MTTLESIFLGKKDLFKGLAISKTDYDWPVHPVIRLDMKLATHSSMDRTILSVQTRLNDIAAVYGVELTETVIEDQFYALIRKLNQKTGQKVIILIDEYDKPLINQLESDNLEAAKIVQKFLKNFYGILKSADEHIRFVFITGVSKFTKVSIFSDLNHLSDISMVEQYAAICGYTQTELDATFSSWIDALAEKEGLTRDETLNTIQKWYNGYRLTKADIRVYNPWSTLNLFEKLSFETYWFETGTPTFLTNMIKSRSFDMSKLHQPVSALNFSTYNIESLDLMPLLFQTGFLTIKHYHKEHDTYLLDYPNYEVSRSFSALLTQTLCEVTNETPIRTALYDALKADDLTEFFEIINTVYANIPAHLHEKSESYYHSIFIAVCQMAGVPVEAEQTSSLGRSDAVLKSPTSIYVVEFKLNAPAQTAIDQIYKKQYLEKYRYIGLPVIPVGVSYDGRQRRISDVKIGQS